MKSRIGAFALLSALALLGFWKYYALNMKADIQRRQMQLVDLRLERANRISEEGRVQTSRALVSDLETRFAALKSGLAERRGSVETIRDIEALASDSALTIRRFAPQPPAARTLYTEVPYKLQMDGMYRDLVAFFEALDSLQPAVRVSAVTITAKPQPDEEATAAAECVLLTVVLPAADTPAGVEPGAAPAQSLASGTRDVNGSRDPFVKPTRLGTGSEPSTGRPAGLRGVRVNEVAVTGIMKDPIGFLAMLQTPDKRTFTVRSGEKLLDVAVKVVMAGAITFSQDGADQRDIVKVLRPGRGGGEWSAR